MKHSQHKQTSMHMCRPASQVLTSSTDDRLNLQEAASTARQRCMCAGEGAEQQGQENNLP